MCKKNIKDGVLRLAVFSSGKGSNAEAIYRSFTKHKDVEFSLLLCNNPKAEVLDRAKSWDVPLLVCGNDLFKSSSFLLQVLRHHHIEFIALAGFLRLLPKEMIAAYKGRIFNIHPSLLPKYGGKGMYGIKVHEAVLREKERISGITIHEVDEEYDKGRIIFSKEMIIPYDIPPTAEKLSSCIRKLEHKYYPQILLEEMRKIGKNLQK